MAQTRRGWWKIMSPPLRNEITTEVDAWCARHTVYISMGEPPSSPEDSSGEEHMAMEEAEDEEQAPVLAAGFTLQ